VSDNFILAKVSAVTVDIAANLPFGVSVLTAVAMAALAKGTNIPLPVSIPFVLDKEDTADREG
jgi:hypothetical protein